MTDLVHADAVPAEQPNGQLTAEDDIVMRLEREGENVLRKHLSIGMHGLCAEAAEEIKALRADISCMINLTADLANEIEKWRGWLGSRDTFIVDQGLWMTFVDQLPALASPNDEGKAVNRPCIVCGKGVDQEYVRAAGMFAYEDCILADDATVLDFGCKAALADYETNGGVTLDDLKAELDK